MALTRLHYLLWIKRLMLLLCVLLLLVLTPFAGRYYRFSRCRWLVASAREALPNLQDAQVREDLLAHLHYVEGRLQPGWWSGQEWWFSTLLDEATEVYRAARGEVAAPCREPGHHVISTVSAIDGLPLPTSVHVPPDWNGTAPLPLVLVLHGGGVARMADLFPVFSYPGVLTAAPLARGSHDYLGVQMSAVEECYADLRRRYPVSEVYVMGHSQGGMGTWLFASRHSGELSGLSPTSGNADHAGWEGFWPRSSTQACSPAGVVAQTVRAGRSPVARVEQIARSPEIPIYVEHGTGDKIVPFAHSESMVARLRQAGAEPEFEVLRDVSHGLPNTTTERLDYLLSAPVETGTLKIPVVIPPFTFVADCLGCPPHRVLDPRREARFTLVDGKLENAVNVVPCGPPASRAGPPDAQRGTGTESLTAAIRSQSPAPDKTTYSGPAGFFVEHPFSFVLPADAPDCLRLCADDFALLWSKSYGGAVRRQDLKPGEEWLNASPDQTVVALGSPAENPAVKAALDGMDVSVKGDTVHLFGKEYSGEDIAVILLAPDRTRPGHGTLVVWGSTPASYRQLWTRLGQEVDWEGDRGRWWFDYAVFDRRTTGANTLLAAGFFNADWQFDPDLCFEGSAALRARMPGGPWPSGEAGRGDAETRRPGDGETERPGDEGKGTGSVSQPYAKRCLSPFRPVFLSEIEPTALDTPRGSVGFDRSAAPDKGALTIQGQPYARGIGVIAPAAVRWYLGRKYEELTVTVGLERTGAAYPIRYEAERVRFEIWGDGKLLANSPILATTDEAVPLTAKLTGVNWLELKAVNTTWQTWLYGPAVWVNPELRGAR